MKAFPILIIIFFLSCNNQKTSSLEKQIDSLKTELNNTYKPGLGEFMSGIQLHHAKLWFAGINNNWELADFEINEIKEAEDDIKEYCKDRPEIKFLDKYLTPAMDTIYKTIVEKNKNTFRENFVTLTNSCNNCHKENSFAFNQITIPTTIPVVNQNFAPVLVEKFDSTKKH